MEELVVMEPDEMLEDDKSLLKVSQDTLGNMCPTKQKAWVAEVHRGLEKCKKEGRREARKPRTQRHEGSCTDRR